MEAIQYSYDELMAEFGGFKAKAVDPISERSRQTSSQLDYDIHKKRLTSDDLESCRKALSHLKQFNYGSNNEQFEIVAGSMADFIGTNFEDEAKELTLKHLAEVGGDFDSDRELARLESFAKDEYSGNKRTIATLLHVAKEHGWIPNTLQSESLQDDLFVPYSKLEAKPPQWLVEGILEQNAVATLYGPPAQGKSFLALNMAYSVACGVPFLNKDVEQGAVFYICGEGHNGLALRGKAWEKHTGVSLQDKPIFVTKRAVNLPATSSELIRLIHALAGQNKATPVLIVLDTLARNFGDGDENQTQAMNEFIRAVDSLRAEFQCSILILHHTGKDEGKGARGNSALKGAMDQEWSVRGKSGLTVLTNHKMKDAAQPAPINLILDEIEISLSSGGGASSRIVRLANSEEVKHAGDGPKLGKNQSTIYALLKERDEDFEDPFSKPQLLAKSGLNRKDFNQSLTSMIEREIVVCENGAYRLP